VLRARMKGLRCAQASVRTFSFTIHVHPEFCTHQCCSSLECAPCGRVGVKFRTLLSNNALLLTINS
jgi:hypothetical protein